MTGEEYILLLIGTLEDSMSKGEHINVLSKALDNELNDKVKETISNLELCRAACEETLSLGKSIQADDALDKLFKLKDDTKTSVIKVIKISSNIIISLISR